MPFQYKSVLLVGATSGIGAAMADKLVAEGSKVIAVGRRQDRLDAFVQKHGRDKAAGVRFDIADRVGMDDFVKGVLTTHPDLDCVFLNAAQQHPVCLSRPETVDLAKFHAEININFSSMVDMAIKVLPHLRARAEAGQPAALIFTGTWLTLIPSAPMPAYCASKAALTMFVECLRAQTKVQGLRIVDIWTPMVQTELHDYLGEERGRSMGMPLAQYTEEAYAGLAAGQEQVTVGSLPEVPREEMMDMMARRNKITAHLSERLLDVIPL